MLSNNDMKAKRNRVSKACELCREKKKKCDGSVPCSQCIASSKRCVYPSDNEKKEKQQKNKPKIQKDDSFKSLDSRLAKLENVLLNLVEKIDANISPANMEEKSPMELEAASTNEPTSFTKERIGSIDSISGGMTPIDQKKNSAICEQYFGTHSTFHILSEESMNWIKDKLGPEDHAVCLPLENLGNVCVKVMNIFTALFIDPDFDEVPHPLFHGNFPKDKHITFALLEYFDSAFLASSLCEVSIIKSWFEAYYKGDKKQKYSELMIMTISLCLCLAVYSIERQKQEYLRCPNYDSTLGQGRLNSISLEDLSLMQIKLVRISIFYYQRISVISGGIRNIQAILLLIIYLETHCVDYQINYVLISIAIRFSQEMGLHRHESFKDLSEEEELLRRKVWWFCQYLDMEICYRSGKPPLINTSDVSTLTERDVNSIFFGASCERKFSDNYLSYIQRFRNSHVYSIHSLALNRIRARSYNELFSASVSHSTFGSLSVSLQSLNNDLFSIIDGMDNLNKPRFFKDPEFRTNYDLESENILNFHLIFFTHLMTINKLPFQIRFPDHDENCSDSIIFRNLSTDSARTILHIVNGLDRTKISSSVTNWLIFFPFSAFLNLFGNIMIKPNAVDMDILSDVELLINASMKFFSYNNELYLNLMSKGIKLSMSNQREYLCDVSIRVFLIVLVRILQSKSEFSFLKQNEQLQQHLNNCHSLYPELFTKRREEAPPWRWTCYDANDVKSSTSSATLLTPVNNSTTSSPADYMTGNVKDLRMDVYPNVGSQGRSTQPSLSNILHPVNEFDSQVNGMTPLMTDYLRDEDFISTSQFSNLPNYFYDNNIGI